MAAAAPGAPRQTRERPSKKSESALARDAQEVQKKVSPLLQFWQKVSNDWVFNFSGTLAYGFLTSIAPILLVIIAIGGLILGAVSPDAQSRLESSIANTLPGGAGGSGAAIVRAATHTLTTSAGPLLVIGIVTAIIGGSGLFVTMENVFGVIFRLRGRDLIHQRIMSIGMLLIFAVLVPIMILVSAVPPAVLGALGIGAANPIAAFFIQVLALAVAFVFAAIFFAAIYIVVPNKPVKLKEVWKGTLVAAALLVLYAALFPIYESNFIHPGNLGPLVGFAVVIMIFFYYLAFILCMGAEVNSWAAGQRPTAASIDAILHELQAHNTTRGAAGPTAGEPQEDLQNFQGASAMRDTQRAIRHERNEHPGDAQPPKFAESGVTGAGYQVTPGQGVGSDGRGAMPLGTLAQDRPAGGSVHDVHSGGIIAGGPPIAYSARLRQQREGLGHPMTRRQRSALAALAATAVVALTGVVQFLRALLSTGRDRDRTPAMG